MLELEIVGENPNCLRSHTILERGVLGEGHLQIITCVSLKDDIILEIRALFKLTHLIVPS